jgi:serine/threonine protein kinase/tetratricopeptide (TPR) repeat protein
VLAQGHVSRRPPSEIERDLPGDRFEVKRLLGWGGMGVVYEAYDRKRRARVALKTLRSMDAGAQLRFKNEFRSLVDLAHPNLVRLGELLEESGQLFFTMELLTGVPFVDHVRGADLAAAPERTPAPGRTPAPERTPAPGEAKRRSETKARSDQDTAVRPAENKPSDRAPAAAPGTFQEARLRAALLQLARGLRALHASGRVHRDIKPSNVLVTPEGRVVILDFGLVTDAADAALAGEEEQVVGTAHFMAPEQAAGRAVGPAADWYAVGVMLYLAMTGVLPFDVASDAAGTLKQKSMPLPPSAVVPDLPADLDALVMGLLRIDPAERAGGEEILRTLGETRAAISTVSGVGPPGFVGRRRELAELHRALDDARRGAARVMFVEGESGVGKSTLVRRFLERAAPSALVLSGRCYERDSVPYKAIDGVVDRVGTYLSKLPPDEAAALLPADIGLAATVFPVLALADSVAKKAAPPEKAAGLGDKGLVLDLLDEHERERPSRARSGGLPVLPASAQPIRAPQMEPAELRSRVFKSMRRLFASLAERRPVVIAIDDLQWADADSIALLSEILRPETPDELGGRAGPAPLLLLASVRTGTGVTPAGKITLDVPPDLVRALHVARLPPDEARDLVEQLLRALAGDAPLDASLDVTALLSEGSGHPLFLDALVRHRLASAEGEAPVRLDDALWARVSALSPRARMLLTVISLAGGPVARSVALHALTAEPDEADRLVGELHSDHFARSSGAREDEALEPYHDRIRETVLAHLTPEERRGWHARLALALETTGSGQLEELAVHWRGAGDHARAAEYAARAGDEAAAAFAFEHAAHLYSTALSLVPSGAPQRSSLFVRLGDALSNGGRGREAAEAYAAAAELYPEASALELRRRAAENLLRSGYLDEGMAHLRSVLAASGLDYPATSASALASLLFRRAELRLRGLGFHERPGAAIPPHDLRRIDVCWSAAMGLGMVDTIRGAYFQIRSLLFALAAGDPYRVSRAISLEIPFVATVGPSARARVDELRAAAQRTAERSRHPHALALVPGCSGIALFLEGRFREALPLLAESERQLRTRCLGVSWEMASIVTFSLWCLWFSGDYATLSARAPAITREAEHRGDRYFATNLCSGFTNAIWLVADDPATAAERAATTIAPWSRSSSHLQHFHDVVARVNADLYRGEGRAAHRYIESGWKALEDSMVLRIQIVRICCEHLRGAAALAAAARSPSPAPLLAAAARAGKRLEAENAAWAAPLGTLLRAGARAREGQRGTAVTALLEEAARTAESRGMSGFAAAARRALGVFRGGPEGRALASAADAELAAKGVVRPDRFAAMLAPGFEE